MRRTTSALTTTILGAALAASAVSAQQILPSDSNRRGDSAASAAQATPAPGTSPAAGTDAGSATTTDPIVGMAATRGARYLLRNGLDYINYQEYERALKYLREAELRQKELSSSEKLALKQAIERAQRGLREAVGSQAPYALSQRTRRPGSFSPAKPSTQLAVRPATQPARGNEPLAQTLNREGDDQGQPIRLTGGEAATPVSSPSSAGSTIAPAVSEVPQPLPITADQSQPAELAGMIGLSGTATASAPGDEKPPETANPQSQPVAGPQAGTSATADRPKADTPVAAQADLFTPLLTGTPATDAKLVEPKTEAPQPAAISPSAANPVEVQPEASEPTPLEPNAAAPLPAASEQPAAVSATINLEQPTEPAPKTPANKPKVDTAVTTQTDAPAALLTTIQPSQPPQIPDPTAAKPSVTVDSNASIAAMPQTSEPGAAQPAAAPAPMSLEQPADAGAKPPAVPAPMSLEQPADAGAKPPAVSDPMSLEQPADAGAKPPAVPDPVLKDLDSMPLPPLGSDSARPKSSKPQTAQDAPAATTEPGQAPSSPSPTAAASPAETTPSPATAAPSQETTLDELPPLPQQMTRQARTQDAGGKADASAAEPPPPAENTAPPAVALAPDDLPPLPQEGAGNSALKTKSEPLPQAVEDLPALPAAAPGPQPAGPEPGLKPEALAQPNPAQPGPADPAVPQATGEIRPAASEKPQPTGAPETTPATPAAETSAGAAVAVPAATPVQPTASAAERAPVTEPVSTTAPASAPASTPGQDENRISGSADPAPPAAAAVEGSTGARSVSGAFDTTFIPQRPNPPSSLRPDLKRQVEEMARARRRVCPQTGSSCRRLAASRRGGS